MATKKNGNRGKNGLSGEKTTISLFYDGSDKYRDPVFVGINGMTWLVQRGIPVEVPVEVAEVLRNQIAQDAKTKRMVRDLISQAQELLM